MNQERLMYCATIFLVEMSKNFHKLNPNSGVNLPTIESYPESHRSALLSSLEKAIRSASSEADSSYENWKTSRAN